MKLADFSGGNLEGQWIVANDDVMGGKSKGGVKFENGNLFFSGETKTELGGFCTIRDESSNFNLGDFSSIKVRVRGDGRTYKFELRTNVKIIQNRRIPYRADFKTKKDEWTEIDIPFTEFEASVDGFSVAEYVPALNPSNVEAIGFVISDRKDGPFQLEVEWVKAINL